MNYKNKLEPLTVYDLEKEFEDELLSREGEAIMPLLNSVEKLDEGNYSQALQSAKEFFGHNGGVGIDEDGKYWDVGNVIFELIEIQGSLLVPADDPYELTGNLEEIELEPIRDDTPMVLWRGTFYHIANIVE